MHAASTQVASLPPFEVSYLFEGNRSKSRAFCFCLRLLRLVRAGMGWGSWIVGAGYAMILR